MRLEFTLTDSELKEAMTPPRMLVRSAWVNAAVWVVLFAFTVGMAAGGTGMFASNARDPKLPVQNFWVTLSLSLAGMTLAIGGALLTRLRPGRRNPFGPAGLPQSRPPQVVELFATAWIVVACCPALAIRWHPTPGRILFAAGGVWFAYLAFLSAMYLTYPRYAAAVVRTTRPSLVRATVVDVSGEGITAAADTISNQYRWSHFNWYRETSRLLLLMEIADSIPLILPKRALRDAPAEEQLRAFIQTNVARGTFLPRDPAFPVVIALTQHP